MTSYTTKSHCKFSLKVHIILVCKYRKRLLTGNMGMWMRTELLNIALASEFDIDTIEPDKDHIHILLSYEPQISISMICATSYIIEYANFWNMRRNSREPSARELFTERLPESCAYYFVT